MHASLIAALAAARLLAQTPDAATTKPALEPGLYTVIMTSAGNITAKLFEKESPITVKNFSDLALGRKQWVDPKTHQPTKRPLYSGVIFHRIVPDFMIQGGDPQGTGFGNGGLQPIPDEFHPTLKFDIPGRLAMANSGRGTGTCQFFITDGPAPHLNGKHTIFGQVVDGAEVVRRIATAPRTGERPNAPVRITRIAIRRMPASAAQVKTGAAKNSAAP